MELIEKRLYYAELFHLYGELLSTSQKEILSEYIVYDLSLSEIAENRGISRAGADDAIKKAMKKLDQYEQVINLFHKKSVILENTAVLRGKIQDSKEIDNIEEVLK